MNNSYETAKQTLIGITNLTDDDSIKDLVYLCLSNLQGIQKEQDRDTRHKCAEAVSSLNADDFQMVSVNQAHRACMNAKAHKL